MNEQSEKLSTLIDEYGQSNQDKSLLENVINDVNHQYTLRRYQMIGEVMRNELPDAIQLDFASSVMAKIEQESAINVAIPAEKNNSHNSSWFWSVLFKPLAGLAVAATVAVVAVSSLQLKPVSEVQPDKYAANDSSSVKVEQYASIPLVSRGLSNVSVNGQNSTSTIGMNWKVKRNEPDIQKKLNVYLVNHNEFSNSWQGIIPQVRVVGFDVQK